MKHIPTFEEFVINENKADDYKNPDLLAKEIAKKNSYLKKLDGKAKTDEIIHLAKDMMQMAGIKSVIIGNLLNQHEDFVPELLSNVEDYLKESVDENDEDSGMPRSTTTSLGPKMGRLVISGSSVEKNKEKIMSGIAKVDSSAKVDYYPATGKIVGTFAISTFKDIQKVLRGIDANISAEIKNAAKK